MITPEQVDVLLKCLDERDVDVGDWCAARGIEEEAFLKAVTACGALMNPSAAACYAFLIGHDARRANEPRGVLAMSLDDARYAVQYAVIDTTSGEIVNGLTSQAEWATDVAAIFNEASETGP